MKKSPNLFNTLLGYNFKVDFVTSKYLFFAKKQIETSIQSHVPSLFPGCQGGNNDGKDGRGGSYRCTDTSGAIIPCADDSSCFDSNGIRIPGKHFHVI